MQFNIGAFVARQLCLFHGHTYVRCEVFEGNKKRKNVIVNMLRISLSMHCHLLVNRIQLFARTSMMYGVCIRRHVRGDSHLRFFFLKGAGVHASLSNIEVRALRGYVPRSCRVASNACMHTVSSRKTFAFFVSFEGCRFMN